MADTTMFTVEEVAERLRVHPETVRRWLRTGKMQGVLLGARAGWRINQAAIDAFLETRRV